MYRLSMNYTEVGSDPSMAIKVSTRVYGDVIETTGNPHKDSGDVIETTIFY